MAELEAVEASDAAVWARREAAEVSQKAARCKEEINLARQAVAENPDAERWLLHCLIFGADYDEHRVAISAEAGEIARCKEVCALAATSCTHAQECQRQADRIAQTMDTLELR